MQNVKVKHILHTQHGLDISDKDSDNSGVTKEILKDLGKKVDNIHKIH